MTPSDVLADPDLGIVAPRRIADPVMIHAWENLTFLHWPFDPAVVQSLLPPALDVDTFEDTAWIGVIPFDLSVRFPVWLPSIPGVSETPEVNVRTYVRGPDGRRGIWFFSLDAARLACVWMARVWYRLPYRGARMRFTTGDPIRYESERRRGRGGRAEFLMELVVGDAPSNLSELDRFLTSRWRLYSPCRGGIAVTEVDHEPWHLRAARVARLDCSLLEPLGVPLPPHPPRALFSPGVSVRFAGRQRIR